MVKKKYFLWVCLFVIVLFIESFLSAHTWTGELVTNGGFEWNNLTGWTTSGAYWYAGSSGWGGNGTIASGNGTYGAYTSTSNTDWTNGYIYQDVNLAAYASYIDAGSAVINATGWGISAEIPPQDWTRVKIMYLFSNGTIIETAADTTIGTQPWKRIGVLNDVPPVGTRYVRVWGNTYESGANQAGIVDSFSVKLGYETTTDTSPPVISLLPPTPSNTSSTTSPVTIVANISDTSNTSSWIDLDRSLLGYWAMDYANSTGVYDNSSYGNFMTFSGGIGVSNLVGGVRGQGLSFDGANYQLSRSALRLGTSATFDVWGYSNDFSTDMMLWNHHSVEDTNYYDLFFAGDMILLNTGDSYDNPFKYANGTNIPLSFISLNVWHHYVVVVDALANKALLYYDGINLGNATYKNPTYNPSDTTDIGGSSGYIWNGYIDEVRIYNRSLSREEILASYDSKNNNFSTSSMTLANGQHNYTVYAIDASGNTNNSGWRYFNVGADTTPPTITFEIPTPSNTSSTTSSVTIVANISDASNTSSWIDFDRSLAGYWAMDYYNKTGIYDNSTWNNFGTFAAGTGLNYTNLTTGVRGQALKFDGVNDELDMPHIDLYNRSFSFSTWVYFNSSVSTYAPLFDEIGEYNNNKYLELQARSSKMFFGFYGNDLTGTATITTGKWYYVVFNYDNSTKNRSIYLNGILDKSDISPSDFLGTTGIVNLGHSADAEAYLNGSLDEVMIFNRSLSATEIKALYDSQSNKFNTSSMTLANGQHNYTVYAIDASGNTNNSGWRYFNVGADTTPPTITFDASTPANTSSATNPVTISTNISDASNTSSWIDFDRSLAGYWAMDYYNSTGVYDNSSWSNFGRFVAGTGLNYSNLTSGSRGNGLKFDGVNDRINLSKLAGITDMGAMTISAWIMPSSIDNTKGNVIFAMQEVDGAAPWGYWGFGLYTSNNLQFYRDANTINMIMRSSSNVINVGKWQHVVMTWNGSNMPGSLKFYVNGTEVGLTTNQNDSLFHGTSNYYIGNIGDGTRPFNGTMDEVMVFNKSLSETEIKALYDSQSNKFNTSSMTLANGQHNYTVYATDQYGNQNNSGWRYFTVGGVDTTSPTYSQVSTNNTIAGQITNFAINVNDNTALNPNGMYIFSINNTGANLVNDTAVNFTTTPSWVNITKTLNLTVGKVIGYRWYFNDSAGNRNSTPIYVLTTTSSGLPFSATWNTSATSAGSTNTSMIDLPLEAGGTYNFVVNWGDGKSDTITTWNDPKTNHTYSSPGVYTVNITGTIKGFRFANINDKLKIGNINSWGPLNVGNSDSIFMGCSNLNSTATDNLDLTGTTTLHQMFADATIFNGNISGWNTGNVTTMSGMFVNAVAFNGNISNWNTGKVTAMNNMFYGASAFNQNISNWNTSSVTDMRSMFASATSFNQNISNWNTGNVNTMYNMFDGATSFNQNLTGWNTGNVIDMSVMFASATAFNGNISGWNTGKVTDISSMFASATSFNQNLSNWNTGSVISMSSVFFGATSFNQNLSNWNTSKVTDMGYMFQGATSFNGNISNWNTGKVTNMNSMFFTAQNFNQNISGWDTHSVTDMQGMFNTATVFNQNLSNWNTSKVTTMTTMFTQATAFNGNISNWDTRNVLTMNNMFYLAPAFNQSVGNWNTSHVTTMMYMFGGATSFNQNISNWDTGRVSDMRYMFDSATSFNQNIGSWNVSSLTDAMNMFTGVTLSTANYDSLLMGWASRTPVLKNNTVFSGGNSKYTSAATNARNTILIGFHNWTITDGGLSTSGTFSATWNTSATSSGSTNSSQVGLPLEAGGTYNFVVNWGDGKSDTITTWNDPKINHTYSSPGVYTVNITGTIKGFRFNNARDLLKINNINSWGPLNVGNNYAYFWGCSNLNSTATDSLDLTGTTDLTFMFRDTSFNGNISNWNTSQVTKMQAMFMSDSSFNGNISNWNTGSVTNMAYMFNGASAFNQNLSNWNTSSVTDMNSMFASATAFNGNISNWNIGKVTNTMLMFLGATSFNQNLSSWNTGKVTAMNQMFFGASAFNGNISNWNTSSVQDMSYMFYRASVFNSNISNWNTSSVTSMNQMFSDAFVFNQNLSNWNTGNVYDMSGMFVNAFAFNGNISNWNTGKVIAMNNMFYGASAFNQNISGWNTGNVTTMIGMFNNAVAFNGNISGWNTGKVTDMSQMFDSASAFNQNISSWNTSSVTAMYGMFSVASAFNQNIGSWNTGKVTTMGWMFNSASAFNQNISGWNTGKVTIMTSMFQGATVFNGNISGWNTGNVTSMGSMFSSATAFNQNISGWNTGNVTTMVGMFGGATSFNQNIGSWNVSSLADAINMFQSVTLSTTNYDALLIGWASRTPVLKNNTVFSGGNSKYTSAATNARNTILIGFHNWTITDGGLEGDTTPPYFTTIPANASLFYANQSLLVKFVATDAVGFGYYKINDTRFSINQTGFLSNATPMAVGTYTINVTINDTSNNKNWTFYRVQINKSTYYSCEVYFNATSPIIFPATFIVYTNCSSAYTLTRNGTSISNASTINAGAGYYNLTVQRTDTANYTNIFDDEFFTVNKNAENCRVLFNATSPLNYPDTFLVWANCTTAFTLKRNGTTITNNSVQSLAVGAYNFSMSRNDTQNYSIIFNQSQFIINSAADTTPPIITFEEPPTPINASSNSSSPVTIVANISDASNTSSWIDIDRSLLLWLSFNGNSLDNSSYNWSTANGGATFGTGKFGQAATGFTSTNHIDVNSGLDYASTNMTISFWMYVNNFASPSRQNPIGKAYGGDGTFTLEPEGNINFYFGSAGTDNAPYTQDDSGDIATNGVWEYWAITRDRTSRQTQWYKNGVAIGSPYTYSSTYDPVHSTNSLTIGDGYAGSLNGSLDEVMIFNRSLSPTEISALYSSTSNKFNTSSMSLANGQHNYTVYATDEYGNQANSGERNFIVTSGGVDCGTLSNAGQTYTLTSNISSTGTCLNIAAPNITLDCNGYWITYSTLNGGAIVYGIYSDQFNTTIKNCKVFDGNWSTPYDSRHGIRLEGSANSTLLNNFVNVSGSAAIYISHSNYILLTNNIGSSVSSAGIRLATSSYCNVTNNTGISINNGAMATSGGASFNIFTNNTATAGLWGVYIWLGSNNNTFANMNVSGQYAYYFVDATVNNTIINCTSVSGSTADVYVDSASGSVGNTFLNCSYNISRESINGAANNIVRKWYYQTYVNYTNGSAASDVNVSAYNITNVIQFTATTDSTGWIDRQEVTEYVNTGGTRSYYNNYTINASKTGFVTDNNIWNFTIQQNKMDDFFTLITMNTCDYISGNWVIDCAENCTITSNINVGGNNISITGTGTFVTSANISNYNKLSIHGTDSTHICRVRCINGGCFKN